MFRKLMEFLARLFKRNKNKENWENEKDDNQNRVSLSDDKPEELTMIDCDLFEVEEIDDNEENNENSFTI